MLQSRGDRGAGRKCIAVIEGRRREVPVRVRMWEGWERLFRCVPMLGRHRKGGGGCRGGLSRAMAYISLLRAVEICNSRTYVEAIIFASKAIKEQMPIDLVLQLVPSHCCQSKKVCTPAALSKLGQ
jgi:hypothetical protein